MLTLKGLQQLCRSLCGWQQEGEIMHFGIAYIIEIAHLRLHWQEMDVTISKDFKNSFDFCWFFMPNFKAKLIFHFSLSNNEVFLKKKVPGCIKKPHLISSRLCLLWLLYFPVFFNWQKKTTKKHYACTFYCKCIFSVHAVMEGCFSWDYPACQVQWFQQLRILKCNTTQSL